MQRQALIFPIVMNFPGRNKFGTFKTSSTSPQISVVTSVRSTRWFKAAAFGSKEATKNTDAEMNRISNKLWDRIAERKDGTRVLIRHAGECVESTA